VKKGLLYKVVDALNTWANPSIRDNEGTALIQGELITILRLFKFNLISF
jgi:hypothetical protein